MKLLFACLLLVGCGGFQRACTRYTGELTYKCSKSGVEYAQSDSGLAVHLSPDGKPMTCK
jgi:hypothetical protein